MQKDLLASIRGTLAVDHQGAGLTSPIGVVQHLAWGQSAKEAVHDEDPMPCEAAESMELHPFLARTLRQAMTLRCTLSVTHRVVSTCHSVLMLPLLV